MVVDSCIGFWGDPVEQGSEFEVKSLSYLKMNNIFTLLNDNFTIHLLMILLFLPISRAIIILQNFFQFPYKNI